MVRQSKTWCFTINNPTVDDRQNLVTLSTSQHFSYLVFGNEIGDSGTPHIQGFVIFNVRKRFQTAKDLIGGRAHLEAARGTDFQAAEYCKKDGDFSEFGDSPVNVPRHSGTTGQFADYTTWVTSFFELHDRPPTEREIAVQYPALFVRYRAALLDLTLHLCPTPVLEEGRLRGWQRELEGDLLDDADDRSVIFYVDPVGNQGKSWFQRWFYTQHTERTQLLSVGKRDDLAHAIDEFKTVFFFNVPRGGMEYLQYTILEQLKDRVVFSPKYSSRTKLLREKAHVVVFCNEPPNLGKMSHDRFDIRILSRREHNILN